MMNKTDLIIIGGFLGAGKTTSILAMAKYMTGKGLKVGIVTNDQGSKLVDTAYLADNGFTVLEVEGGCFCCFFDEFTDRVMQLKDEQKPDVILAEPVGSCTDLITTIFRPMQKGYTDQFRIRPLSIVVDPKRLRKLMMEQNSLFPNEINYLFVKQIEEADIIVLNKIDCLSDSEIKKMTDFLNERFPNTLVRAVSAKEGLNMELWANTITDDLISTGSRELDIDYKTYAKAESYLGWLNYKTLVQSPDPVVWNDFLKGFIEQVKNGLKEKGSEIAHLKAYCISESEGAKISITSIDDTPEISNAMSNPANEVQLIINARVSTDPESLKTIILEELNEYTSSMGLKLYDSSMECFAPKEPKPKYRIKS